MRIILYFLVFSCVSLRVYSQEQSMLYEKDWGVNDGCGLYYADELPNGDYILIGGRRSALYPPGTGYFQNYMCRINFRGDLLWEKEIGFPYAQDYGGGVIKTSS
ncbi:MAG TPA: hypothetical protein VFU15_11230, partial [Bacteroidia bacterium]|nr:hypothetical protein [Bacteroidia bacterium]